MTAADAYALSSLAVDLGIGEAVDVAGSAGAPSLALEGPATEPGVEESLALHDPQRLARYVLLRAGGQSRS